MGIYLDSRGVKYIYAHSWPIVAVYTQGMKIWPRRISAKDPSIDVILSCYYNGYWIDEYPWTDDTPWTD